MKGKIREAIGKYSWGIMEDNPNWEFDATKAEELVDEIMTIINK